MSALEVWRGPDGVWHWFCTGCTSVCRGPHCPSQPAALAAALAHCEARGEVTC